MSEDEVEISLRQAGEPNIEAETHTTEFGNSEEFNNFVQELINRMEEGTPLAHVIAHVVMNLFQPGFVIVGSPSTIKTSEGYNMPHSLGVSMGGNTDITAQDLAILLHKLADSLANKDGFEGLLNDAN